MLTRRKVVQRACSVKGTLTVNARWDSSNGVRKIQYLLKYMMPFRWEEVVGLFQFTCSCCFITLPRAILEATVATPEVRCCCENLQ